MVAIASSALTGWPDSIGVVAVGASVALPVALVLASFEATLPFAARALVGTIIASGLVLLAASVYVATVVGFEGTPDPEQRSMLAVSLVAAGAIALLAVPARRRLEVFANERVYGESEAPDAALHTFAGRMSRAVPMDELLRQLAETLHKSMRLRRAEVWTGSDGVFDLAVAVPDRSATRLTLGREESTVAARTPVSGIAWSAVWVPALAEGRGDAIVAGGRVAHLGELLGFIVANATPDASASDEEQDRVLTEHRPPARARSAQRCASTPRCRRASTSSSCATPSSPPPAPDRRRRRREPPRRSSATCTTAPSSTWSRWR